MSTQQPPAPTRESVCPPDFRHVACWVFDLDHTLYTVDDAIHAGQSDRICLYIQRELGLEREPATEMRHRYYKDYGSTLGGLLRHHGIDADHYHDFVNDIDALGLTRNAALRAALARLAGRRIIFTNNCGRYAEKVLARLGIADLFDDIVDARVTDFTPKPNDAAYAHVAARGAAPGVSAMFEDSPRNLAPAHARGMTTVWLSDSPAGWMLEKTGTRADFPHIHHQTDNLATFLNTIRI